MTGPRPVNLIPRSRQDVRRRTGRIRGWTTACVVYIAIVAAICVACRLIWRVDASYVAEDLEQTRASIADLQTSLTAVQAKVKNATASLQTAQAVAAQPDWSIMLALLGSRTGDEIVLASIRLEPTSESRSATPAAAADALLGPGPCIRLDLQGHARTPAAVSTFVSRLQGTKLFDEVKLIRTARESYLGGASVSFQLQATMDPSTKK